MPQIKNGKIIFKLPSTLSISFKQIIILVIILGTASLGAFFYHSRGVRSANYGWAQTTWQGGASTTATARHSTDQSGWTKYQSTNNLISTSTNGEISLKSTSTFWTDTATADFNAASASSSVYALNGTVYLKKPNGVSCSNSFECDSSYCYSICRTCGGKLYGGKCFYLGNVNESCTTACSIHGGSAGAANDTTNCDIMKKFVSCSSCYGVDYDRHPSTFTLGNIFCIYSLNISLWTAVSKNENVQRLCACNN